MSAHRTRSSSVTVRELSVCFQTFRLPPEYGGASRQALTLARELRRRGLTVWFLVLAEDAPAQDERMHDGFRVIRIGVHRASQPRLLDHVRIARLLFRKRASFHVLHVHWEWWWTSLVAKLLGKRVVQKVTLMGWDNPSALSRRPSGWLRVMMLRRADVIIATAERIRRDCLLYGLSPRRVKLVRNAVVVSSGEDSGALRARARAELSLGALAFVVVFLGRLSARKGVDVLLAAWDRAHREIGGSCLILAGPEDPELPALARKVERLAADGSVRWLGHRDDPTSLLAAADVFCLPSRSEGLSNALLEAMAAGLPCVVSAEAAPDFVSDGDNALIVAPEDVCATASALQRLAREADLRYVLGRRARETVRRECDLGQVADQCIAIYRD